MLPTRWGTSVDCFVIHDEDVNTINKILNISTMIDDSIHQLPIYFDTSKVLI